VFEPSENFRKSVAFYVGAAIVKATGHTGTRTKEQAAKVIELSLEAVDLALRGIDNAGYDLVEKQHG
jgi:hypothetical protein